MDADFSVAISA